MLSSPDSELIPAAMKRCSLLGPMPGTCCKLPSPPPQPLLLDSDGGRFLTDISVAHPEALVALKVLVSMICRDPLDKARQSLHGRLASTSGRL